MQFIALPRILGDSEWSWGFKHDCYRAFWYLHLGDFGCCCCFVFWVCDAVWNHWINLSVCFPHPNLREDEDCDHKFTHFHIRTKHHQAGIHQIFLRIHRTEDPWTLMPRFGGSRVVCKYEKRHPIVARRSRNQLEEQLDLRIWLLRRRRWKDRYDRRIWSPRWRIWLGRIWMVPVHLSASLLYLFDFHRNYSRNFHAMQRHQTDYDSAY